jgi:hypothetical protein
MHRVVGMQRLQALLVFTLLAGAAAGCERNNDRPTTPRPVSPSAQASTDEATDYRANIPEGGAPGTPPAEAGQPAPVPHEGNPREQHEPAH